MFLTDFQSFGTFSILENRQAELCKWSFYPCVFEVAESCRVILSILLISIISKKKHCLASFHMHIGTKHFSPPSEPCNKGRYDLSQPAHIMQILASCILILFCLPAVDTSKFLIF